MQLCERRLLSDLPSPLDGAFHQSCMSTSRVDLVQAAHRRSSALIPSKFSNQKQAHLLRVRQSQETGPELGKIRSLLSQGHCCRHEANLKTD